MLESRYRQFRRAWRLFAIPLCLASTLRAQTATGQLSIHYINVGQADAIYIECPEPQRHNMLIDSGDVTAMRYPGSPKLFQDQLKALMGSRTHIDVVIASHPHSDHAGSILWVLNNFDVGTFIDDGMLYDSATYAAIQVRAQALSDQGSLRFLHASELPNGSEDPDFCPSTNIEAILLKPDGFGHDPNPNNNSVIIRLTYGTQRFLFTGDAETEEEHLLLNDPATRQLLPVEVLKAPHHGSNTSSSLEFLNAVKPAIIVVSAGEKDVGTNKGYKHPRAETMRNFLRFTKANGKQQLRPIDAFDTAKKRWVRIQINKGIYDTAVDGAVVLVSEGQHTWNEKDPAPVDESGTDPSIRYVSARNSKIYHFAECADAKRINPNNRTESDEPPAGKELHRGCPR